MLAEKTPKSGHEVNRNTGGPGCGGVGGDPGEEHAAGGDVDEEQHVAAPEQRGVHSEEVTGDRGLGVQKSRPGDSAACGCGVHSGVVEDLPHGGGSEAVAVPGEFAVDAAVTPCGIVRGQDNDELAKLR